MQGQSRRFQKLKTLQKPARTLCHTFSMQLKVTQHWEKFPMSCEGYSENSEDNVSYCCIYNSSLFFLNLSLFSLFLHYTIITMKRIFSLIMILLLYAGVS